MSNMHSVTHSQLTSANIGVSVRVHMQLRAKVQLADFQSALLNAAKVKNTFNRETQRQQRLSV